MPAHHNLGNWKAGKEVRLNLSEPHYPATKAEKLSKQSSQPALKAARRAHTSKQAPQEPQIQSSGVNQHSFENGRASAEVHPPQAPCLISMGEWSLQLLATLAQQPSAARSTNPSSIAVHGFPGSFLTLPIPPTSRRFGDVG